MAERISEGPNLVLPHNSPINYSVIEAVQSFQSNEIFYSFSTAKILFGLHTRGSLLAPIQPIRTWLWLGLGVLKLTADHHNFPVRRALGWGSTEHHTLNMEGAQIRLPYLFLTEKGWVRIMISDHTRFH